jgi:hypothetical protein
MLLRVISGPFLYDLTKKFELISLEVTLLSRHFLSLLNSPIGFYRILIKGMIIMVITEDLKGRDFLTMIDFSREEIETMLDVGIDLKKRFTMHEDHRHILPAQTLFMVFYNDSLRTRNSFTFYNQEQYILLQWKAMKLLIQQNAFLMWLAYYHVWVMQ